MRKLDALIARRGRPAMFVSDNCTELTSRAVLEWANRAGVEWHYIAPDFDISRIVQDILQEPFM